MSLVKKSIIIEDRVEETLSRMPSFLNKLTGTRHNHFFKKGEEIELAPYLKKISEPYPLIWLAYPMLEKHESYRKAHVRNMSLIIAVRGDTETILEDRFENSYKNILMDVFDNVRYVLEKSNTISVTSEFDLIKFPNYGGRDRNRNDYPEIHKTIDVWDAIKVTFNCSVNDNCLKLGSYAYVSKDRIKFIPTIKIEEYLIDFEKRLEEAIHKEHIVFDELPPLN